MKQQANSIAEYIAATDGQVHQQLSELYIQLKRLLPEAKEKMSYGMPTFYQQGNLVHFAAWKTHIGFYPAPSAIQAFSKELEPFVTSKGAIQFPLGAPLPKALIERIVAFRLAENMGRKKAGHS